MNDLPPINLKEDAWEWVVFDAIKGSFGDRTAIFQGECQSYTACLMTFKLLGIRTKKERHDMTRLYYGDRQVFIQFTRVTDGVRMTEWGSKNFEFPPG
jgi:hypothetical protein